MIKWLISLMMACSQTLTLSACNPDDSPKKTEKIARRFLREYTQHCVINDDAPAIVAKMHDADVIVFATPIYYYEMCGQLKTLLDRANPLYSSDYHFRDIYMLTSAAEDEEYVPERAVAGLTGWIDCFEKARLTGTVFAGGVSAPGETEGHPSLVRAYEMGKAIKG